MLFVQLYLVKQVNTDDISRHCINGLVFLYKIYPNRFRASEIMNYYGS